MNIVQGIIPILAAELDQGSVIGYPAFKRKVAEASPGQAVLHLSHQRLVSQFVASLEIHHPQVGGYWNRRPAHAGGEPLFEGGEETFVIQQSVNLSQLFTQMEELRWQNRLPERWLVVSQTEHRSFLLAPHHTSFSHI